MNLSQLKAMFVQAGARRLYAKPLAENDNSKNQVYFGPDFQSLNLFPNEGIVADSSPKNPIFKAKLRFGWIAANGAIANAPGAQLILYPQYPEVRFSGFLKGCAAAPSSLIAGRMLGRVLFLAVTGDRRVIGFVVGGDDEIAAEFRALGLSSAAGVFIELSLPTVPDESDSRTRLLIELHRINRLGWIDSKQLDSDGGLKPCLAPQCGGFTLEAELGIPKNSVAEPDFLGWEVKQHSVTSFARPDSGTAITLMTPEPTGGFYKERGVEAFIRKFGYPDKNDRPDRLNFGGIHRAGERQTSTGLTMQLAGYDSSKGKITDAGGAIMLVSDAGEVAAAWAFSGLLAHWSRKHMRAAYVPSMRRTEPRWQYAYGGRVRLAQRTDPLRLLAALASGAVYYDPGIKLEHVSTKPGVKRRSQFRIASKNIAALYETVEMVEV
ncbi:MAG TPA: MvaI/BcnI family restriction endonuclease [Candidatus Paceibacterota bacterium]|nr:MvaI/BcnI family restriction endonuclease [Candidatus Paceibacterota bacterium]